MSQISIIVASGDTTRLYAALEAAMAWTALGRDVEIFCQGEAVAALRRPLFHAGDRARVAAGQPDLATLLGEVRDAGAVLYICQTGLALAGMTMEELAVDARAAGLVGYLAAIPPGALVVTF